MRVFRRGPWLLVPALVATSPSTDAAPAAFVLHGTAREADGTPLAGRVVVTPTLPSGEPVTAAIGEGGRFAVEGLPRATVRVEFAAARST